MEKQISAVDWIVDFFESGVSSVEEWTKAKEQAKEMEKEQIKNSYHSGAIDGFNFRTTSISPNSEQYYNETFKSE